MARKSREWLILRYMAAGEFEFAAGSFKNAADAEKWIKTDGKDAEQYQIVCFIGEPIEVTIHQIEKRLLTRKGEGGGKEVGSEKGD